MVVRGKVMSWVRWWEVWLPGGYLAQEFIKEAPAYLLPFAALMSDMNKPLLSQLKERIMNASVEAGQKQDLLAMLVFFACRMFSPKEVMEVIHMDLFTNNPLIAYLEHKSREEGKLEGKLSLLQSQAKKRFPHIGETTLELLQNLSEESLQQIGEEILDVANGREFRQRLLQLQPKKEEDLAL
jgi:predicted transposase YdaD